MGIDFKELAAFVMSTEPLFFDTETSGVGDHDQIITLSVLNKHEEVVYNKLFKPTCPLDPAAMAIHKISEADIMKGLDFKSEFYAVKALFDGRVVVAYNAMFDVQMLKQSMAATGYKYPGITPLMVVDAMILYSRYANVDGFKPGSPKWYKQSEALEREGINTDGLAFHDSVDDVRGTIRLMQHLSDLYGDY